MMCVYQGWPPLTTDDVLDCAFSSYDDGGGGGDDDDDDDTTSSNENCSFRIYALCTSLPALCARIKKIKKKNCVWLSTTLTKL